MDETGRKLVFVGTDRVEIESFKVPEPGPGQVLIRVHRSQVSAGSEKNKLLEAPSSDYRRTLGYAAAGHVLVVMPGYPPGSVEIELQPEFKRRELDIRGVWAADQEYVPHPYWPWTRYRSRKATMRMIASGDLKVDHLISHVCKPEEANDIFQRILAGPKGWMSVYFDWD